ncbi:helicase-related protein [Asaia krungthepensis]|uniref:DNA helicase n=1 Tax=Asaia krungthepensis NRIC 0535 TaxID=1307925 RepID=A0ABQ0Q5H7_9PROT|nr:helicase-related protein [Asaia krungthepensis]GBQ92431.1 DNA helicase [Asaia krungthepensis NRIC 0535]
MTPQHHFMPRRVRAVLGPTNTGKTHYALERLLAHESGIIGFPLRLLARENYERMVRIKGSRHVALITGEEKIVPPEARWFSCTTEAMPLTRRVEFVAVDEIQLSSDPDRGHVFTDRLLNARGNVETLFLGAETIRPLLQRLVPGIEIDTRPRLSSLIHTGHTKLSRLPARSAIVAFSAAEVYAIAEIIRRRRGGCALIMGQLSPRTRNAQVELYQNKDVDYLVATDAIGMGLNMDVNHVALASLTKFDGSSLRPLTAQECAQIAGRAGRGMKDGTFGTTGEARPMSDALVDAIEAHRFDPVERVSWRNAALDFGSPAALLNSLNAAPPKRGLVAGRPASDVLTLESLSGEAEIRDAARGKKATSLLWDVCQIPDFRKLGDDSHVRLCHRLFLHLLNDGGIPPQWFDSHISGFSRLEGDIDTLMHRLTGIRVCAYVAARTDWSDRAIHWQERTREVEDLLSDALHERLTARFVDRRATSLLRRLDHEGSRDLLSAVTREGQVIVEGHSVGTIEGFTLKPDQEDTLPEKKLMLRAGRRALLHEIPRRVQALVASPDDAFSLDTANGHLAWEDAVIARLTRGAAILSPSIQILGGEFADTKQRDLVQERLTTFVQTRIRTVLAPLYALAAQPRASAPLRGVVHRLMESGGVAPLMPREPGIHGTQDLAHFRRLGILLCSHGLFMPALLKPAAMGLRARLVAVWSGVSLPTIDATQVVLAVSPDVGRQSMKDPAPVSRGLEALGWMRAGTIWLRLDRAEKLSGDLHRLTRRGACPVPSDLASRYALPKAQLAEILPDFGVRLRPTVPLPPNQFGPPAPPMLVASRPQRASVRKTHRGNRPHATATQPEGPFAVLARLSARPN